jgi:hypothetical protein
MPIRDRRAAGDEREEETQEDQPACNIDPEAGDASMFKVLQKLAATRDGSFA